MIREYLGVVFLEYKKHLKNFLLYNIAFLIMTIFVLVLYFILSVYDGGLIAILVTAFLYFPFLYAFYYSICENLTNPKININNFYRHAKSYYSIYNRGSFNAIINFLLMIVVQVILLSIAVSIYFAIFPSYYQQIIEIINNENILSIDILNIIVNMPYFIIFYLLIDVIAFLFFLSRIHYYSLNVVLGMIIPMPYIIVRKSASQARKNKNYILNYAGIILTSIAVILFLIGAGLGLALSYIFREEIETIQYMELFTLSGGILFLSFYMPILGINNFYAANDVALNYLLNLRKEMVMRITLMNSHNLNSDDAVIALKALDVKIAIIKEQDVKRIRNINPRNITRAIKSMPKNLTDILNESLKCLEKSDFEGFLLKLDIIIKEYSKMKSADKIVLQTLKDMQFNAELMKETQRKETENQ